MTPPILRVYQHSTLNEVRAAMRQHKRILLQSPTGSGKGVMIAFMIGESARRGLSAWLLCHRRELTSQLSESLWEAGVLHGRMEAGFPETKDRVQVGSIQTVVRRLGRLSSPALLAVDECHHATAATYQKIIDHCQDAWIIGLTATPARTDGRGLGDVFDALVHGPTVTELTEQGYLSPYRIYAPAEPMDVTGVHSRAGDYVRGELTVVADQSKIIGDAVDHYRRLVAPGTCLVYCVSRVHAHHVADIYRQRGIDAQYVAGDTPKAERNQAIEGFRTGSPAVIVSVDLFGEGLDVPALRAVQLLRPTQSMGLFLQQVGRGLRVEPGKERLVILDHVGNSWIHGLPDDERHWTLEGRQRRRGKAEPSGPALRHCDVCFSIYRATFQACPLCGEPYVPKGRSPEEIEGELEEIKAEEHRRQRKFAAKMEVWKAKKDLAALVAIGKERSYKPGWAPITFIRANKVKKGTRQYNETFAEARRIDRELGRA